MGKRSGIGSKKEITTIDPMDLIDSLFSTNALDLFDASDSLVTTTKKIDGDDGDNGEQPEALIYQHHRPGKRELKTIAANEYLHQVLTGLPEIGSTYHCISNSRFNFFSFIPSIIKYLGDYTTTLYCATWTTNNINSKQLIELFDNGKIGRIVFVVGNYFKVREAPVYNFLASKLLERKQTIIAGEHHAKILLLHNKSNYIVIESSANLCANPRTEQFTYSNDQDLFHFYQKWFDSLAQKEKPNEQRK